MNKHIDGIMQKEMTRHEFLAAMGFGLVSILCFSTIIKMFTGNSVEHRIFGNKAMSHGYGSSPYGGGKE